MNEKQSGEIKGGLALVLALPSIAVFLYLTPGYFENVIVGRVVSAILAAIGLLGLGTELNKMTGKKRISGIDDFSIGLVLILIWVVAYISTGLVVAQHPIVNTLVPPSIRYCSGSNQAPKQPTGKATSRCNQPTNMTLGGILVQLFLTLLRLPPLC